MSKTVQWGYIHGPSKLAFKLGTHPNQRRRTAKMNKVFNLFYFTMYVTQVPLKA